MGGGVDDGNGVLRPVGDGIGDPEQLDTAAVIIDAARDGAVTMARAPRSIVRLPAIVPCRMKRTPRRNVASPVIMP